MLTALIELALWMAIFATASSDLIGGFPRESYLAYALWTAFISRITASWSYEFKMIEEIESGTVNSLIVRPLSFFEYYLSQLLGYKFITSTFSLAVPLVMIQLMNLPTHLERVPLALLLITCYLVMIHTISFIISTLAFHFNRVYSVTMAKNLGLWILTGELLPLDLIPSPYKDWLLALPFCNAVYIPVAYITGRIDVSLVWQGFVSLGVGTTVFGCLGFILWRRGLKNYVGTGA